MSLFACFVNNTSKRDVAYLRKPLRSSMDDQSMDTGESCEGLGRSFPESITGLPSSNASGNGSSRIRKLLRGRIRFSHDNRANHSQKSEIKAHCSTSRHGSRGSRPSKTKSTSTLTDASSFKGPQSPTHSTSTISQKQKTKVGSWVRGKFCKRNPDRNSRIINSSPPMNCSLAQTQCQNTGIMAASLPLADSDEVMCVCCTPGTSHDSQAASTPNATRRRMATAIINQLSIESADGFPINADDLNEPERLERAREIAEGLDPPIGFIRANEVLPDDIAMTLRNLKIDAIPWDVLGKIWDLNPSPQQVAHTTVDYMHCLIPDLAGISRCGFYWGKMDRYEAEKLLDKKPEGSFLLRDSAQEDYLFSVSFRRYGRSLHARIEQWNHKFSFDSYDPGVFSSSTVCGLIEHYKDPACCMYFEPMLTIPINRNFPFSLQHLSRSAITQHVSYNSISKLNLPKTIKAYLREYHYKQRLRVRNLEKE